MSLLKLTRDEAAQRAPASAARRFGVTLRLLPEDRHPELRSELLAASPPRLPPREG